MSIYLSSYVKFNRIYDFLSINFNIYFHLHKYDLFKRVTNTLTFCYTTKNDRKGISLQY